MYQDTRIDHAIFQLTPTRTRCDLLIFTGGKGEKLASGLLEPFLSHLKAAKDQISKGGYSITLQLPKGTNIDASWFTKGTLERFVRFVSTPEILERVVTIENEILQIENSVHFNEILAVPNHPATVKQTEAAGANTGNPSFPSKSKNDSNGDDAGKGENSKLHLQRILETRKAVLGKEQGMAYARASAAGFEMDHIDGLISFSKTFGACRLREACMNFKDLCKKKLEAGLWLDELAAMEASSLSELSYNGTSGIMLTSETTPSQNGIPKVLSSDASVDAAAIDSMLNQTNSKPDQDTAFSIPDQCPSVGNGFSSGKAQLPMSYLNQPPQYMYNFQSPVVQPAPLHQGYLMPGMQVFPQYHPMYPGHMQRPPQYMEDSGSVTVRHPQNHNTSSETKDKSMNRKGSETSDSTQDDSGSDNNSSSVRALQKKGPRKKSSRVVVIRNINYVTSRKSDGGKDNDMEYESISEDDLIDGDALKQKVEDAVDSFEKHRKSTQRLHKKKGSHKHPGDVNALGDVSKWAKDDPTGKISEQGSHAEKSWLAFENLLMRDDDSSSIMVEQGYGRDAPDSNNHQQIDIQEEHFVLRNSGSGSEMERGRRKEPVATDSFIATERDTSNKGDGHLGDLECDATYCKTMKKNNFTDEELLFSHRTETDSNAWTNFSNYSQEPSVQKAIKGGDWIVITQPEREETTGLSSVNHDQTLSLTEICLHTKNCEEKHLVDDSFVVPIRTIVDEQPDAGWKIDISIDEGLPSVRPHPGQSNSKIGVSSSYEPDDIYMLLDRNCRMEPAEALGTPEIDYDMDLSVVTVKERPSVVETNGPIDAIMPPNGESNESRKEGDTETKHSSKGPRPKPIQGSLGKSKLEIISRNRKSSTVSRNQVQKSKKEKEEEERRRIEELLIQRKKRIAERHGGPTSSKQITSKHEKETSKTSPLEERKKKSSHKSDIVSSTKCNLTSKQNNHKGLAPKLSTVPPKRINRKENAGKGENATDIGSKDPPDNSRKRTSPEMDSSKLLANQSCNAGQLSPLDASEDTTEISANDQINLKAPSSIVHHNSLGQCNHSSMVNEQEMGSDALGDKSCYQDLVCSDGLSLPTPEQSAQLIASQLEGDPEGTLQDSTASQKNGDFYDARSNVNCSRRDPVSICSELKADACPTIAEEVMSLTDAYVEGENNAVNDNFKLSSAISDVNSEIEPVHKVVELSTSLTNGMNSELSYLQKKWTCTESSSTAKGLKKLLMFGQKSRSSHPI